MKRIAIIQLDAGFACIVFDGTWSVFFITS